MLRSYSFVVFVITILALPEYLEACKGCVSLDNYNFDKIISRFEATLVKFDVAYPYGEKHDAFTKLAEELVNVDQLVLAQVGIKDYGEKDNEELAKKNGINSKEDLPALRLYIKGMDNSVEYPKNDNWGLNELRSFIRDNTNIYIGLPGCLEEFDKIAMDFCNSNNKQGIIDKSVDLIKNLNENDKKSGEIYLKYMRKVLELDSEFIQKELRRLGRIIKDKSVNENLKKELENRLNVLRSFSIKKDEL